MSDNAAVQEDSGLNGETNGESTEEESEDEVDSVRIELRKSVEIDLDTTESSDKLLAEDYWLCSHEEVKSDESQTHEKENVVGKIPECQDAVITDEVVSKADLTDGQTLNSNADESMASAYSVDSDSDIEVIEETEGISWTMTMSSAGNMTTDDVDGTHSEDPTISAKDRVFDFLDRFVSSSKNWIPPVYGGLTRDDSLAECLQKYVALEERRHPGWNSVLEAEGFTIPPNVFHPPSQVVEIMAICPSERSIQSLRSAVTDENATGSGTKRFSWAPCPKMTEIVSDLGYSLAVETAYSSVLERYDNDERLKKRLEKGQKKKKADTSDSDFSESEDEKKPDKMATVATKLAEAKKAEQMGRLRSSLEEVEKFNEAFSIPVDKHCFRCSFKTDSSLVMAWHLSHPDITSITGSRITWACHICADEFNEDSRIMAHYAGKHKSFCILERGDQRHPCDLCGASFPLKGSLLKHVALCRRNFVPHRHLAPVELDLLHINRLFWPLSQKQLRDVQTLMSSRSSSSAKAISNGSAPNAMSIRSSRQASSIRLQMAPKSLQSLTMMYLPKLIRPSILSAAQFNRNTPAMVSSSGIQPGSAATAANGRSTPSDDGSETSSITAVERPSVPPIVRRRGRPCRVQPSAIPLGLGLHQISPQRNTFGGGMRGRPRGATIINSRGMGRGRSYQMGGGIRRGNSIRLMLNQQKQNSPVKSGAPQTPTLTSPTVQRSKNGTASQLAKTIVKSQFDKTALSSGPAVTPNPVENSAAARSNQLVSRWISRNKTAAAAQSNGSLTVAPLLSGAAVGAIVPARGTLVCEVCDFVPVNYAAYLTHLQRLHQRCYDKTAADLQAAPPLACSRCNGRFHCYEGLERHLLMQHNLVTTDLLMKAQKKADGGRCQICSKVFAFNLLFHIANTHKRTLCSAEVCYNCDVCKKNFNQYRFLEEHLRGAHGQKNEKPKELKEPQGEISAFLSQFVNGNFPVATTTHQPTQNQIVSLMDKPTTSVATTSRQNQNQKFISFPTLMNIKGAAKRLGKPNILQSPSYRPNLSFSSMGKRKPIEPEQQVVINPTPPAKKMRYNCTPCQLKFNDYSDVLRHWQLRHLKPFRIQMCRLDQCDTCVEEAAKIYQIPADVRETLAEMKTLSIDPEISIVDKPRLEPEEIVLDDD